jgi:hypothetical protein
VTALQGLAPALGTRGIGGTSIQGLGSDEEEVRQYRAAKKKRAIIENAPLRDLPTNPDGTYRCRVFRIPQPVGFRLISDMKRRVVASSGDEITPPSWLDIKFIPSHDDSFGELVLEPEPRLRGGKPDKNDETRATLDARRVEIIERWALDNPHLAIIDWVVEREKVLNAEAAAQLPELVKRIRNSKELMLELKESFADVLTPKTPKKSN